MRFPRIASLIAIFVLGAACTDERPLVDRVDDDLETTASMLRYYSIEASVERGEGSIVCDDRVRQGDSATCRITPAPGFGIDALLHNSKSVLEEITQDLEYVIENVQSSHTVVVHFWSNVYLTLRKDPELWPTYPVAVQVGGDFFRCEASSACGYNMSRGDEISLVFSEPPPGMMFAGWTGMCEGQPSTCNFTAFRTSSVILRLNYVVETMTHGAGTISCEPSVAPGGTGI